MDTKNNIFYQSLRTIYISSVNAICDVCRRPYINSIKRLLIDLNRRKNYHDISIISSNCFAGRIMQDLKMPYNSPTLGLYFMYPDYIEFLRNLKFYLTEAKIEFVAHSKYPIGDERRSKWSHWYPIGLLDGKVEIHFLHYHTEEEAAEKWYRRAARVNFDNILVIGMDQNLCTYEDVKAFNNLPFKYKIIFSRYNEPLESNEYMPEFASADSVGDPYKKGHIFYRHLLNHFNFK